GRIARRNRREYLAAAFVAASAFFPLVQALVDGRLPAASTVAGSTALLTAMVVVTSILWRFGAPRRDGENGGLPVTAATVADEIRRHARLLLIAPVWYALPTAAGGTAFVLGVSAGSGWTPSWWVVPILWVAGLVVSALNVWEARRLQRVVAEL
ncbi:MAG: hypothetical protein KC492_09385, partial [Myxococcales bacterium]|nr:hypothetical protein [Myxococcales bacterium]